MRVIVNENITRSVILGLRDRGYDVLSVKESMRGADDISILQRAEAEQRLVVTQDKDFGELAFKHRLPSDLWDCVVPFVRRRPYRRQSTYAGRDAKPSGLGRTLFCRNRRPNSHANSAEWWD